MKKKYLKFVVAGILVFLVASGVFITIMLGNSAENSANAPQQTKAAALTYSKTVNVNTSANVTPTVVPMIITPTPEVTISPTSAFLAATTPTVTPSGTFATTVPTTVITSAPTTAEVSSLPVTGAIMYSFLFVGLAFGLIVISFIF